MRKVCQSCHKIFNTYSKTQEYCSKKCKGIASRERVFVHCDGCGVYFEKLPYLVRPTNYCSLTCYYKSKVIKFSRNCLTCNKLFTPTAAQVKHGYGYYCSRSCDHAKYPKRLVIRCEYCGKMVEKSPAVAKHTVYCSKSCHDLAISEFEIHVCVQCNKDFKIPLWEIKKGKGKFCSRECFIKYKGESSLEQKVREWLDDHHVQYEQEKRFGKYRADFCLEDKKLIIECDGEFWHMNTKAEIRDHKKDNILINQGYKVIRLSGTQILKGLSSSAILRSPLT